MLTKTILALLLGGACVPVLARSGSWNESGYGGQIQFGGLPLTSHPLKAPASMAPEQERVHSVSWMIDSSTLPHGMVIHLCTETICLKLPGVSGTLPWPTATAPLARSAFMFVYEINQTGRLSQPFVVRKNQLIVNYQ